MSLPLKNDEQTFLIRISSYRCKNPPVLRSIRGGNRRKGSPGDDKMQGVLEQNLTSERVTGRNASLPGRRVGILSTLFGCWHRNLSRPFTEKQEGSYRVCMECGAHALFDTTSFKTLGGFYYPPVGDRSTLTERFS